MAVNPRRPRAARGRCVAQLRGWFGGVPAAGRRVGSVLGPRYSLASGSRVGPRGHGAGDASGRLYCIV